MSEHVDILMTGVGALAAVYAGKYITSLASATQKSAEKTIADIKLALAEKQAAQAALQQAQAEAKIAREAKQAITAQLQLNQTVRTTKALKQQLALASAQLEKANNAGAAAQARINVAMKATNFAAKGLQATMAMLGGPAGMLLLAAGALTIWSSKAEEAKQKALGFADAIDDVNESLKDLTVNQLNTKIDEVEDDLDLVEKQAEKTASKLRYLQTLAYNSFNRLDTEYDTPQGLIKLNREITDLKSELDKLSQSKDKLNAKLQRYKAAVEVVTNKTNDSSKKVKSLDDALKSVGENKIDEKVKSLST